MADGRILLSGVLYSPETTLADYQAFKHVTVLEPEGGVYRPLYNYDNHQISHLEFKRLGEDEIVLEIYFKDQSSVWVAHGILTGRRLRCIDNFPTTCDLIKQLRAQAE